MKQGLIGAAIFEFAGAISLGHLMSPATLKTGIISPEDFGSSSFLLNLTKPRPFRVICSRNHVYSLNSSIVGSDCNICCNAGMKKKKIILISQRFPQRTQLSVGSLDSLLSNLGTI